MPMPEASPFLTPINTAYNGFEQKIFSIKSKFYFIYDKFFLVLLLN